MQLNEEQLLAVHHAIDAPACLVAGAGSGKTRVLTERVRWLTNDMGVPPHRILCLTFTNKAAGEMVSRLGTETQNEVPHVTTIHSLALSLIRKGPVGFGLLGHVTPLDDYDQEQMLKKIVEAIPKVENESPLDPWKVKEKMGFHRARGLGFSPEYTPEYHKQTTEKHGGYHAMGVREVEIWKAYEDAKKKASVVDFDDMLHLCVRRGRQDEDWLLLVNSRYQHVLMDEAQDTNPVQWEFVNMFLGPQNMNFYAVGDMGQSIYGFNGAMPKLLLEYSQGWRGVVPNLYRIQRNHRSVPEIVRLANRIQTHMTETIPLKMESFRGQRGETGTTKLAQDILPSNIADKIAREIWLGANRDEPRILYKDNCILVRSASQIRDIEGELVRLRIPYLVRGGRGLMQTEEVRDVLSYLRLAVNPNDYMAFTRAVSVPRRGIGKVAMDKLRYYAEENCGDNLIEAAKNNDKLSAFVSEMQYIQNKLNDAGEALKAAIQVSGYLDYLRGKYEHKEDLLKYKIENLTRLLTIVTSLVEDNACTAADIVFRLTMDRPEDEGPLGKVIISTIHAAKGLEWSRVYVFSVVEGYLPHKFAFKPEEVEEERRLWYVAVTRARDALVVCVPEFLQYPKSEPRRAQPSRFLYEVGIVRQELNIR